MDWRARQDWQSWKWLCIRFVFHGLVSLRFIISTESACQQHGALNIHLIAAHCCPAHVHREFAARLHQPAASDDYRRPVPAMPTSVHDTAAT